MNLEIRTIVAEQTHALRQKILRPNQLVEEMTYPLDNKKGSHHMGAYDGDILVGIVSVYPESQDGSLHQGDWRIRGMAVDKGLQGKGVGRNLVQACLSFTRTEGAKSIWCNARTSAVGFYFTLGFQQKGDEFEIEGIGPHYIAELIFIN